ncbi:MAG TPA: efflux transporter outer membrane subunit [Gemmatimonadales bacterium]|nr:efflux transporter outer membrane subunit [Gemmatimonadales bacterium]
MRSTLLFGFAVLYGCASAPGYRAPSVAPAASFREMTARDTGANAPYVAAPTTSTVEAPADRAEVSFSFWVPLGDTTFSRLMAEASRANWDVQAGRARVSAARSDRVRTVLDLTPSATVSGGYARQRLSAATFPGAFGVFPDQNVWTSDVTASWDLDVFGRIRHGVQAQGALVGVAEEELRDVQVSLTAELARGYFELRGAQEQLQVARQNAENERHTFELTRQRLEAGRGSAFDTERAQAQLSSTLASIPVREAQVAAAAYRIGVLVGRSPTAVAQEFAQPAPIPALPDVTPIERPEALVRGRPDVAAAERRAAAQGALVGAAKAAYLPRLTIGATAGYAAPEFQSVGNQGTFRYVVGPVLTWPALNLGRVKAEVDAAAAREDAARADYSRTVLAAIEDVETSLSRYRSARLQVERLAEASAASERAAELARLRFKEGVTDFLQVLDAERTELEAQDRLAQGRTDAATAYAALYRSVGGR